MLEIYCHPRCTTCKKAKQYLNKKGIEFKEIDIVENHPNKELLKKWVSQSHLSTRKFFNTSGNLYKELKLKDKLDSMNDEEMLELLASDGMLVKRPVLIATDKIVLGFKEPVYEKMFK